MILLIRLIYLHSFSCCKNANNYFREPESRRLFDDFKEGDEDEAALHHHHNCQETIENARQALGEQNRNGGEVDNQAR